MKLSLSPEIERLIEEKVSSGRYQSADEVVRESLELLDERDQAEPPPSPKNLGEIVKLVESITADVPDSVWETVPSDLSQNIDHCLYGTKKRT